VVSDSQRIGEEGQGFYVFGRPIGQNQGVQLPLADAYSILRAVELQVLKAAWRYD
jgi:acyl-CoA dehydrogenase